jgi:hypothetical protein
MFLSAKVLLVISLDYTTSSSDNLHTTLSCLHYSLKFTINFTYIGVMYRRVIMGFLDNDKKSGVWNIVTPQRGNFHAFLIHREAFFFINDLPFPLNWHAGH